MATREGAGCTIKVEAMDSVHGRDGAAKDAKATGQPDGGLALAEVGCDPR